MSSVKAKPIDGGAKRRRKLITLFGSLGVGGGVVVSVVVAVIMQGGGQPAQAEVSASEVRLREMADRQIAETQKQEGRLREHPVGEGSKFDGQGVYLGAPATSSDGLVDNKTIDQMSGGAKGDGSSRDARELAALTALSHSIERGAGASDGGNPGESDDGAADVDDEGKGKASGRSQREPSAPSPRKRNRDKGVLWNYSEQNFGATTALAYSTIPEATWALRRPAVNKSADRDRSGGNELPERSHAEPGRGESLGGGGGARAVMMSGNGSAFGGGVPAAPSVAGAGLYADDSGGLPAERQSQLMVIGEVGDMRIGGRPIGPGGSLIAVGPDEVVRQGKFLECALTHEMRVDLVNSPMRAQIIQDFLSADGKYVLYPAGAQVLGSAGRVQNAQQARAYIKATRVVFPRRSENEKGLAAFFPKRDMPATDAGGAIGVDGEVDRHFWLQFGAAVMLGVLDGMGAALQANTAGERTVDSLILGRTSNNLSNVVAGIVGRYGNVVPTISIEPGAKLKIYFDEDVLVSPYMLTSELAYLRERRVEE
jgi:hypothetical protein